ncbi:MAG: AraC family transcriptional regulator [Gammaproteobacteria bacterium]|nr:AraC family transcriptional regulator [Gammaproteobacteria bacterium]
MDTISDFFPRLKIREAVYTRVEASAPWGLDFIPYYHTKFGIVTEGECFIDLKDDQAPVSLKQGSCYLLTRGDAFRLRDKNLSDTVDFEDTLQYLDGRLLRYGGGGDQTTIIGGRFIFANDGYPPILDLLPPLIHFKVTPLELQALEATIQLLANETSSPTLGSNLMVDRLADIFFIQSLRAYLLSEKDRDVGWVGAVADKKLSTAIGLMHNHSDRNWTIASLAQQAGMSRSVFAARFKEKLGTSPISYLTRYRLNTAQQLLQQSSMSIAQVANKVGYESEAAFNKAFKRELGIPPGEFRKKEYA